MGGATPEKISWVMKKTNGASHKQHLSTASASVSASRFSPQVPVLTLLHDGLHAASQLNPFLLKSVLDSVLS